MTEAKDGGPRLLSGGNPQIAKGDGDLRGAELDPLPPVGSKDPDTRYVHIHEDEELDEELLTSWIEQAAELPGWDGF